MQKFKCIFCQIAKDRTLVPEQRLLDQQNYYLLLSLHPQTKGHALLVPKKHRSSLSEMPKLLQGFLFQEAVKMAGLIQSTLKARAYVLRVNNDVFKLENKDSGHVGHIHIHIIPRYKSGEKLLEKPKQASKKTLMSLRNKLASSLEECII